jgi:uncharacterized membrane protein
MSKETMSMLFVEHQTAAPFFLLVTLGFSIASIVALFLDHNHNSTFVIRYDPTDKSLVPISLLL